MIKVEWKSVWIIVNHSIGEEIKNEKPYLGQVTSYCRNSFKGL